MPKHEAELDRVFQALSDVTRRVIIERLVRGPASVKQLADPFAMSLPSVMQHLSVLESCGLVHSEKVGRVRTCRVDTAVLRSAEAWLSGQHAMWEHHLDRLGEVIDEIHPEAPQLATPDNAAGAHIPIRPPSPSRTAGRTAKEHQS